MGSIFKSVYDGIGYRLLYLYIPIGQALEFVRQDDKSFLKVVLLLFLSLCYDSYTRYNEEDTKQKRIKIIVIAMISIFLVIATLVLLISLNFCTWNVSNVYFFFLIPASVIWCISLKDLMVSFWQLNVK